VCSGFPKRSCSLKKLKRDGDSAKSHRALGRLLAGLNSHGWLQTLRLNPASLSFPFAGRGRLTLRFKPMLLVRGGFHRPGKSGGPPLLEPSFKVEGNGAHNQSSGFAVAPGLKGHNARGPLKVQPKLHSQRWAFGRPRFRSAPTGPPVHAGRFLLRWVQIALKPAPKTLGLHGVFIRG
jgi:hypothetical protein